MRRVHFHHRQTHFAFIKRHFLKTESQQVELVKVFKRTILIGASKKISLVGVRTFRQSVGVARGWFHCPLCVLLLNHRLRIKVKGVQVVKHALLLGVLPAKNYELARRPGDGGESISCRKVVALYQLQFGCRESASLWA